MQTAPECPRRHGQNAVGIYWCIYTTMLLNCDKSGAQVEPMNRFDGNQPLMRITWMSRSRIFLRNVLDRKSTRLNSSHLVISYAVFCLKKKIYIHFYTNVCIS